MNRLIFAIGALFLVASNLTWAQSQDEAFQGLKWGDPLSVIKERFTGAAFDRMESCDGETVKGVINNLACTAARYTGYKVADLSFRVSFYLLAPEWRLEQVGLIAIVKKEPAEALSKCKEIESLLSTRYGVSKVLLDDVKRPEGINRYVSWDDGRGAAMVLMNCTAAPNAGVVSVDYLPKIGLDAKKL